MLFHLRRSALSLLCLLTAALAGCADPATSTAVQEPGEALPIEWQKSGTYSRLTRPVRILARDRATLAQVPLTEVPVDFERQMVLIHGIGPTPRNDVGVRIDRIWRDGSRWRVQESVIHPGFEEPAAVAPSSPWTVVVIPRSDLNVEGYTSLVPPNLLGDIPGGR